MKEMKNQSPEIERNLSPPHSKQMDVLFGLKDSYKQVVTYYKNIKVTITENINFLNWWEQQ